MNQHSVIKTPTHIREEEEDVGRNPSSNLTMGDIINKRFSRRGFMQGSLAVTAIAATVSPLALLVADEARAEVKSAFDFEEIAVGVDEKHHVAAGYDADILLRWGDKIFADAPDFDPMKQTAEAQARQFGYNNDYVGFIPLEGSTERGLLVVNHEYTNAELMFPNWATIGKDAEGKDKVNFGEYTKELVDIEMAAHGGTVIELKRENGKWTPVLDSKLNRRITAGHGDGADRAGCRACPRYDHCRSLGEEGFRHAEQLCGRRDALGHLSDGRGEFPRLLRG